MKDRTMSLKKWLDKFTITSNFNYTDHELAVDMNIFYKLFQEDYPILFKKQCYFLQAVPLYANKVMINPKVVEMNKTNQI